MNIHRMESKRRWLMAAALLPLLFTLGCGTHSVSDCQGLCYRNLPDGGCQSMPTCCPVTVPHSGEPSCPQGYTLDLNAPKDMCAAQLTCVD